jgi:hypothetical protein
VYYEEKSLPVAQLKVDKEDGDRNLPVGPNMLVDEIGRRIKEALETGIFRWGRNVSIQKPLNTETFQRKILSAQNPFNANIFQSN